MGATGEDPWVVRGGCMDLGAILRGGHASKPPVWFRDMGDDPPHGANIGGIPPLLGPAPQVSSQNTARTGCGIPPPLEDALRESGLEEIMVYIVWRYNTVTHYIASRTILDICLEAMTRPGAQVVKQWWEQEVVGLSESWS